ncbi:phosphotransferase enzyme family protein [Histoplasma capsulatum G186AR]|uniref:Phosphotransferase enzyme family protein n=1 Tax=Ajellomyces capsulatus TaxID=5037 RepID=A0A8H7YXC6_AJECA|nr:phosphotransferase enzyme family protein [Histoplasma capsulatum]QSS67652.1 phosphotransferase enzyme family protein [Histoplasma capsulatum G186AR]
MQLRNALRSFLTQYLPFRLYSAQQFRNITGSVRRQLVKNSKDELFQYTSGRWIYNEHLRLTERYLEFDIPALQKAIAAASGHSTSDIISFFKLAEGGFNRLFQVTFNDGNRVIARIPYPSTGPEHYGVASEVATLDYLRLHGITTPKVYAWCSTRENPTSLWKN